MADGITDAGVLSALSTQGLTLVRFLASPEHFSIYTLRALGGSGDKTAQVELRSGRMTRGLHSSTFQHDSSIC